MKTFKLTVWILALIMFVSVLSGCGAKDNGDESGQGTNDVTNNSSQLFESTDTIVNDDGKKFLPNTEVTGVVKEGSESLDSNKFVIGGKTYALPIKISYLLDDGWSFLKGFSFENDFVPGETNLVSFYLVNENGIEIQLEKIINDSSDNQKIEECYLSAFVIDNYHMTADFEFVMPGGITQLSTAADIISVLGDPNKATQFSGYSYNLAEQLTYSKHNVSNIGYSFVLREDEF